ncbi:MAG: hypothetical protein IV090_13625 [Candidatus Sericytochromatia bacterium]|nr:hypothetical protein [Candidatus Sericytochromatia bacterium]
MQNSVFNSLLKALKPAFSALSLALVACQAPANLPQISAKADAPLSISVQTTAPSSAHPSAQASPKQSEAAGPQSASKTNLLPAALLKQLPTQVASIKLQSDRSSFTAVGQQAKLSLSLLDAEGKEVPSTAALRWSSSHPERIAVASTGALSATLSALSAAGPAEISVQLEGTELKTSINIAVVAPVVESSSSGGGGGGGGGGGSAAAADPGTPAAVAPTTESLNASVSFENLGRGEFNINTFTTASQVAPEVAMQSNGNFVVVWESHIQDGAIRGVYAQRFDPQGLPLGSEFRVNTTTANDQYEPAVAMDSAGNFVVAWTSTNQDGSGAGIYAQRYNAAGVAQGSEFRVNVTTAGGQYNPAIGLDGTGNFVIAYTCDGLDGGGNGVEAVRFDASGQVLGSFQANTTATGDQSRPSIGMNSSGQFVISWDSNGQDGDGSGIYAQRYSADGSAQGSEFRVNTQITGAQSRSSLDLSADGRFVVSWESSGQDGSDTGVYAQRYAADGSAQGLEFRVNTTSANSQSDPSIAMDSQGNFVVTWISDGQDGSGAGIYAQRYNASGVAQGAEFQVNTKTSSAQLYPKIDMLANGAFTIVWQSQGSDGNNNGIVGKRFSAQGHAL